MSRSLTDVAPAALVPAAWAVVLTAVVGLVSPDTLFVVLAVMASLLGAFAFGTRDELVGPVLGLWRWVLVLGFVITLVGAADLAVTPAADPTLAVTLYGWAALPALALVATAQSVDTPYSTVYLAGSMCSLAGAATHALAGSSVDAAVGIAVVGLGQTAATVAAVVQNADASGN
ncbi:hypothetical protein [Halosimplex sp. TS25]|uniref:hypothetical protein n=1 Tax=Halosimplex rarum TaxID=3396619 RepID=UPI0039E7920D